MQANLLVTKRRKNISVPGLSFQPLGGIWRGIVDRSGITSKQLAKRKRQLVVDQSICVL